MLLASDFDGTLAEITGRPSETRLRPDSSSVLAELAARLGRVTVISGRSPDDLRRLVPVPHVHLRGDYGLGEPTVAEVAALDAFERLARPRLPAGAGLERKPSSLSLHHRAAPSTGPALEGLAAELAHRLGLSWRPGRLVVEVMPRRAQKERALAEELSELGPGAVVFGGDDSGDRGCFELVSRLEIPHLAVGVASPEADPAIFAQCDAVVTGPAGWTDVLSRLARWAVTPAAPAHEDR